MSRTIGVRIRAMTKALNASQINGTINIPSPGREPPRPCRILLGLTHLVAATGRNIMTFSTPVVHYFCLVTAISFALWVACHSRNSGWCRTRDEPASLRLRHPEWSVRAVLWRDPGVGNWQPASRSAGAGGPVYESRPHQSCRGISPGLYAMPAITIYGTRDRPPCTAT